MAVTPDSATAKVTLPTDEQILITREFDAAPHLVYKAWTTPELVKKWWNAKRGEVTVNPEDPSGKGWVNFQYHKEESPGDSKPLVEGIKMVRRLTEQFGDLVEGEVWPGKDASSDAELAAQVEKSSWGHHANGTAKMGAADDPMAVVDSNFKVRGTKGLRVVDAAVFPDNVGSFIVSGVMQISEKAADDIIEDAVKDSGIFEPNYDELPPAVKKTLPPGPLGSASFFAYTSLMNCEAGSWTARDWLRSAR